MGKNRGYKGGDYRYQPRVGRSTTSARFSERAQNFAQQSTTNTSQEYELVRSDWRLIDISSSIHPTSGSILYGGQDASWSWIGDIGCKRNLVRYEYDRQNQYVEFSFRPVKGVGHVYMVGFSPKLESFGFRYDTVLVNSAYHKLDTLGGIYVNNAVMQAWTTSAAYTFTWTAGDKFSVRFYVDGPIRILRNNVVEYTVLRNTKGMFNTSYSDPYWGNGQELSMTIYPNNLTTDTPFIYDVRTVGPFNYKTPFQDLFTLPTSSMQLTGLANCSTGSDAQGLTYASKSAGAASGWNAGAKSSQLFDPQYGGDIFYGELPYNYGLTTTDYSMHMALCSDGANPGTTNWYNTTTFRGGWYNGGDSGKKLSTFYYGAVVTNNSNNYQFHASASVRFARVISNIETAGWPYSSNPVSEIASVLFFHPNGTDPNITEDWHPVCYQIGANATNYTTCRAAFCWKIPDSGQINKLTFATSSRT
jgi:hypothetical protein